MTENLSSSRKPRLILVGSAPIRRKLGPFIDICDLIIRCNDAKNLGGNAGTRTHVLCLDNTGDASTHRLRNSSRLQSPTRFPALEEVWFSQPSNEVSTTLLESNGLGRLPSHCISAELRQQIELALSQNARAGFEMPSTGFCAFWYVLHAERFQGYDKFITGFSFEVWHGHPQDAERDIILDICDTHPDFTFLPVAKHWKLHRTVRNFFRKVRRALRSLIRTLSSHGIVLYALKD